MKNVAKKYWNATTPLRDRCPDVGTHTPAPSGQLQWASWAEVKNKTHVQQQCPTCHLWTIWVPRKAKAKMPIISIIRRPKTP
jgi:hypothetical protein